MPTETELFIRRDLNHIWHPCSQMKDFEKFPPFIVHRAKGSYLYTDKGPVIDAISSWWCKSLGHGHPAVIEAIEEQLHCFEHVISANTTHPKLIELGEKLAEITHKQHVLFASDGSSSVEIALKIARQAKQLQGNPKQNKIIALANGYHGETLGALSITDVSAFKATYADLTLPAYFLNPIPYVNSASSPLWSDCTAAWPAVLSQLEAHKETTAAIIVEPIIQGAGNMRCYSADFLFRLAQFAKENAIYLIADEIMTGMGRTGKWLASHHAHIEPDIICLSKGLTSGTIPFSCTLVDNALYELFYDDYETQKAFLHSHTFSGNALGVSAALATIHTISAENLLEKSVQLGQLMHRLFQEIASESKLLTNIRTIGAIVAADFTPNAPKGRLGFLVAQEALALGALLRPIGNTLYWMPPLNTDEETIHQLAEITLQSIQNAAKRSSA